MRVPPSASSTALGDVRQRGVDVARRAAAGDPRQPRPERERLALRGPREAQEVRDLAASASRRRRSAAAAAACGAGGRGGRAWMISPVRVAARSVRRRSMWPRRAGRRRRERIRGRCSSSALRSSRRSSSVGVVGAAVAQLVHAGVLCPVPSRRPIGSRSPPSDGCGACSRPPRRAARSPARRPRKCTPNSASKRGMSSSARDQRDAREPVQAREVGRRRCRAARAGSRSACRGPARQSSRKASRTVTAARCSSTASVSSCSLTSRPSERRSASGHAAPSSASSSRACAHSIVSAIPGGLISRNRAHAGHRLDQRRRRVGRQARAHARR